MISMENIKINKVSYIDSESSIESLKKLYNEFTEQYFIKLGGGTHELIIKESFDKKGIDIQPENGKIVSIYALKPDSKLEIRLIESDFTSNFSVFKTKDDKTIVINHKDEW